MSPTWKKRLSLAAYIVVGVTAATGFGTKIYEFARSFLTGTSSFALPGLTVYFAVAAGFMCLFLWSTLRGQFGDIEGPKQRMLDRESALDAGVWLGDGEGDDAGAGTVRP